jgi:DNA-binding NarL/FixJ family response regulator
MWQETRRDITLMDLALEDGDRGVDSIRKIRKNAPLAKIIVFSAATRDEDIYQVLRSGSLPISRRQ